MKTFGCILLISLLSFFVISCKKNNVVPDFTVTTSKTSYKVGDTVVFKITGNPDLLSVYTGDKTHEYRYKDRDSVIAKPEISLSSYRFGGAQLNSMSLLISTDFSGNYNVTGVKSATWYDITSRAVLSSGTDNTQSGIIDISDIVTQNKSFVFAFKKHDDFSATLKPQSWTIRAFFSYQLLPDNSLKTVSDITGTTGTWQAVDVLNPLITATVSTTLSFPGGALNSAENEDWIISKKINPYKTSPDLAIPIKGLADPIVTQYTYKYTAAGTYNVTFVAGNANKSSDQTAKTLQVVIN